MRCDGSPVESKKDRNKGKKEKKKIITPTSQHRLHSIDANDAHQQGCHLQRPPWYDGGIEGRRVDGLNEDPFRPECLVECGIKSRR